MLFVVLCPGTPEGSTGSGSGFKASQKTGQRLKVSSDRLGEAGNRTCDPWFTRHRFIPYTPTSSNLWVVNDKPFCKTAVSKKCVRGVLTCITKHVIRSSPSFRFSFSVIYDKNNKGHHSQT